MKYRIGLDVGSTTAKMVVIDERNCVVWSRYERHNAQVKGLLQRYLAEVQETVGGADVTVGITGSVGMQTAELLGAEFVQEVVAASAYARRMHPEAQALIDIGGEDSKVVLFSGSRTDLRMNGNCAGGTGAFIDQMVALLGLTHDEMNGLALRSTQLHPMAARCGVFAKTDVQNLVSRHVPTSDVCASIFHSIAVQTITTLAHGQRVEPPILLCGGPLTFLPALRKAFADYMKTDENHFIVTRESNLVPAIGTALTVKESPVSFDTLWKRLGQPVEVTLETSLPPLFASSDDYEAWRREKATNNIEVKPMRRGREEVVVGIDSGSTTTKIIAARRNGDILFSYYAPSLGNPIKAVADGLAKMQEEAARSGTELAFVGSCSTGYGEDLIKAAFSLDSGIIETMAHYRAARRLMPDVSFILDIGGQDMKAIFVEQGVVTRMELNEACSSGCGTFLQTFAQSLNRDIGDFARQACTARRPCDLGTRCTVFMNSKIKQVLREGADVSDIAAGLSYSVVNNCLFKVLKLKDVSELGQRIVVQGGTMRNDAVVRALELLTGCTVARSNMPEMMGAYGCALYAAEHACFNQNANANENQNEKPNGSVPVPVKTSNVECHGCENRCHITRYEFSCGSPASPLGSSKNIYVSGNKCERVFTNSGSRKAKGLNIYTEKYRLLFDREVAAGGRRIGLPRMLNIYENYPFWHSLLTACGFQTVLSPESTMPRYEAELCTVMSDNICFPAKLVHSHVAALRQQGVERILMPYAVYEQQESTTAVSSYNCPIVAGYSDVIRSAMPAEVPVDSPVVNFASTRLLRRQVTDYLHGLGVDKRTARRAFTTAWAAQKDYERAVKQCALDILDDSRRQGRMTILLAGRPYHTDPLIQHRLSETIAAMGVNVISEDIVRETPELADGETNTVRQWAYVNRIIKAAQWAAGQGSDVQFVQMTSFGCGPDAFIQDEVRSLLARYGKVYTLLKIDDVSNVGSLKLRVRSLIESLTSLSPPEGGKSTPEHFLTTKVFRRDDERRTILVPHISEFITPLLPALGDLAGYRIEVLPPSDAESAAAGLRYANNEVCYPATLVVGDIIRALQSGRYASDDVAVAMTQTGGQCRATNYAGLIKRAMVQAGFADVPVVTLGVTTAASADANEQDGFRVSWRKIGPPLLLTLLYTDTIAKMYYAAAAREEVAGLAAALRDRFLQLGADDIRQSGGRRLARRLLSRVEEAAGEFNMICRTTGQQADQTTKVGIVGEIFLKFNHFAHQQIQEQLMRQGVEIVPPLFTPFFLQEFVNVVRNRQMGLTESRFPLSLVRLLYAMVHREVRRFNEAAAAFRHFIPFDDIRLDATRADGIVSPAAQFGEGWLLPAEISAFAEHGINNVISLQPFGCIANHVVARGVENAIRRRYPDINLINLDFDSGVSAVNITNRLLLFLSQ